MKKLLNFINPIKTWFFWGWILFSFVSLLSTCDHSSELKKTINNIKKSKKGFLKINFVSGNTMRTPTIYGFGYIEGVEDSLSEHKILLGRSHTYFSQLFDKDSGDLVPVWYTQDKHFVMERIYDTHEVTIKYLNDFENEGLKIQLKISLFFFSIYLFLKFLGKGLSKIVPKELRDDLS